MLRFCFGASGSGKSTRLYEEIIEESLRSPETSFFIVVPDQFTMQAQRDVVRLHPRHAILNIDVLSFSRLSHRIFDEVGGPNVPVLDDMGKTLVLRHVAGEIAEDLPVLGRRLTLPGFTDEVKSILSEFLQYRIGPEDLDLLIGACGLRGQLAARLKDLQTVYRAFLSYIEGHFVTAEETMTVLAGKVLQSDLLRDAVVVFDGFTGFTPIQYQVLSSILQVARQVTISLLMDPDEDPFSDPCGDSIFHLSRKTASDLIALCPDQRKITDDIIIKDRPVRRLMDNAPLAYLEKTLFRHTGGCFAGDTGGAIVLTEAGDPVRECEDCCIRIREFLRDDGTLRFEDIAVLCTDPETYAPLMEKEAADFAIPVWLDRTEKLKMNPLVECMESAMEIVRDRYSPAAVFRFLRCPLSGFSGDEVDRLQIHVEALGIRGKKSWEERFLRPYRTERDAEEQAALLQESDALRARLVELITPLASVETADVRSFSTALITLFDTLGVQEKLRLLAGEREAAGDEQGRREYEQIYGKVIALIDQMVSLLGDQRISIREYEEILRSGLEKITIGMLPGSIDRVVVGDMERTRLGEKKIVFLLGVNDSLLPKNDSGGGLLNEMDRRFLAMAGTGVELAPDAGQRLAFEREYLYMNLTKPSRSLLLSWSLTGLDGRSMRPADLVRQIRSLYPALPVSHPEDRSLLERIETRENAQALVAAQMRDYADARLDPDREREFLTLFGLLCGEAQERKERLFALADAAFFRYTPSPLTVRTSEQLYGEEQEGSVSRMELFAGCPFSHFVRYGLRLKEEDRFVLEPTDLGLIYHGALEGIDRKLRETGGSWRDLKPDIAGRYVHDWLADYAAQYRNNILLSNARYQYMTKRIERVLLRTVDTISYQIGKGSFDPAASEWEFREKEDAFVLRGRVDRVDICEQEGQRLFRVIDFKSGQRKFDPALFYYGLQLQLMLYLRAVAREEKQHHPGVSVIPAGVFYYRVNDPMLSGDSNKISGDIETAVRKSLSLSGIANSDGEVLTLMDSDLAGGGSSDILPVGIKKDGDFTASSIVLPTEGFTAASEHVGATIRQIGTRIRAGEIAASPYRYKKKTACAFCAYRGVCGFDRQLPGYSLRELPSFGIGEALQRIQEEGT
ncbi:MAG: PD-(D/E)XK nuclease family protein [Lachnospiraceae bacterium]|nr:PD-(D/E)XK nuclease family protein [Lachnospiraceae bacterium]